MDFRKQRDAFQILYDYFRRGRQTTLHVVVLTPYIEHITGNFLGYSALVKDYSKLLPPSQSIDEEVSHDYSGFLGANTEVKPIKWKKYEVLDYHYKRPFNNLVLGIDYDAIERDFPADESDSDDDGSEYHGLSTNDVAVPDITFNDFTEHERVRVFKILAKIKDFATLLVGETRFTFGLRSLPVDGVNDGYPLNFCWDVGEMQLVENDTLIFLPNDCLEKLETIWLNSNTDQSIFEFLLIIDFDRGLLRFGLNDKLLPQAVSFHRNIPYEIRIDFAKTTESLMILEVFNQPKTLSGLGSEFLLNMYLEQAEDLFGCQWPEDFAKHLVDEFYFRKCSKESQFTDERHPMMTARKSLVEAFRITKMPSESL